MKLVLRQVFQIGAPRQDDHPIIDSTMLSLMVGLIKRE